MVRLWIVEVVNMFKAREVHVFESAETADTYAVSQAKFGYKTFVWEL